MKCIDVPSSRDHRHIPVELCEHVIDMLYSDVVAEQVGYRDALHCCALVCRDWRIRAQRRLFYCVVLDSSRAVQTFSAVLITGPHLCDYVYEVTLTGRTLHTTASPLSLFPIALYKRLPRFRKLIVTHIAHGTAWYPRSTMELSEKQLECIPLHPRFSTFLSSFNALSHLSLFNVTFKCFGDFARMIHSMPCVQRLECYGVGWLALGPLLPFMNPPDESIENHLPPFAPMLNRLAVCFISAS